MHGVLTDVVGVGDRVDVIRMIHMNDFPRMVSIVLASGDVVEGAIVEVQVGLRRRRGRHDTE